MIVIHSRQELPMVFQSLMCTRTLICLLLLTLAVLNVCMHQKCRWIIFYFLKDCRWNGGNFGS